METTTSGRTSSMETLLEERAQQLFLLSDRERKGFIVKRDMQVEFAPNKHCCYIVTLLLAAVNITWQSRCLQSPSPYTMPAWQHCFKKVTVRYSCSRCTGSDDAVAGRLSTSLWHILLLEFGLLKTEGSVFSILSPPVVTTLSQFR